MSAEKKTLKACAYDTIFAGSCRNHKRGNCPFAHADQPELMASATVLSKAAAVAFVKSLEEKRVAAPARVAETVATPAPVAETVAAPAPVAETVAITDAVSSESDSEEEVNSSPDSSNGLSKPALDRPVKMSNAADAKDSAKNRKNEKKARIAILSNIILKASPMLTRSLPSDAEYRKKLIDVSKDIDRFYAEQRRRKESRLNGET
jgi:hypothetical protein